MLVHTPFIHPSRGLQDSAAATVRVAPVPGALQTPARAGHAPPSGCQGGGASGSALTRSLGPGVLHMACSAMMTSQEGTTTVHGDAKDGHHGGSQQHDRAQVQVHERPDESRCATDGPYSQADTSCPDCELNAATI